MTRHPDPGPAPRFDWRTGPSTAPGPDPFYREYAAAEPQAVGVHPPGPEDPAAPPVPDPAEQFPTQAGRRTYELPNPDIVLRSMTGVKPALNQPWYGIGFTDAFKRAFQKQGDFSGRASRGEFWWFFLANSLIETGVVVVTFLVSPGLAWTIVYGGLNLLPFSAANAEWVPAYLLLGLGALWWLVSLFPKLAVTWRRLHDAGHSGGWFFIQLIVSLAQPAALAGARYDQHAFGQTTVIG
ncbi:MAG: DUF805 domain-containing protein [Bifidobacteriaceae bacterium]|nr:DUF805 domain-containing protein [Bifidobacteriaceae bacterium]